MTESVPFNDLARDLPGTAVRDAIEQVVDDGRFVGGPAVAAFEHAFARFTGAEHCVGVGSGTAALQAALRAYGVGPGDEVVTVSATFAASAAAIVHTGASPVFVDIDPTTRTMDPRRAAAAITPRTRALLPVDLYGHPADLEPLRALAGEHGLAVIADAAQAHGARYRGRRVGSLAHATCFSFYPSKNLGALGDAGAVTTDDPVVAERIRQLRDHGRGGGRHQHVVAGHNWRLDAMQAAVLSVKLARLDEWNKLRRDVASEYARLLAGTDLELPSVAAGCEHAYHLYVVRCRERDRLREALTGAGIGTGVHYPRPVHRLPPFQGYLARGAPLAVTDALAAECLSLPMFPGLRDEEVKQVAVAVDRFLDSERR